MIITGSAALAAYAALSLILYICILRSLDEMPLCEESASKYVLAFAVTALAVLSLLRGSEQNGLLPAILLPYRALAIAILLVLVLAGLGFGIGVTLRWLRGFHSLRRSPQQPATRKAERCGADQRTQVGVGNSIRKEGNRQD